MKRIICFLILLATVFVMNSCGKKQSTTVKTVTENRSTTEPQQSKVDPLELAKAKFLSEYLPNKVSNVNSIIQLSYGTENVENKKNLYGVQVTLMGTFYVKENVNAYEQMYVKKKFEYIVLVGPNDKYTSDLYEVGGYVLNS